MWSIDELQNLWHLVSKLHDGQKYGGQHQGEQIEYLSHIGSVAFEIINAAHESTGIDAEFAIKCALLHDTLEDTNISFEKIESHFGKSVAEGVLALTKNKQIDGPKQQMADSLARIKKQPKEVWAVKLADRISNLYAPPFYWTNEKKKGYLEEANFILEELEEGNKYLAKRLEMKIKDYEKFID